jgi:phosphatidylinositol 4-kinase
MKYWAYYKGTRTPGSSWRWVVRLLNCNLHYRFVSKRDQHVRLQSNAISQKYLAVNQSLSWADTSELGASIAEQFGKMVGPVQRQLSRHFFVSHVQTRSFPYEASLSALTGTQLDLAKKLASQIACKGYFAGETAGLRLATHQSG